MKRFLCLIVSIILIFALASTNFAAGDIEQPNDKSMKTYFIAFSTSVDLNLIKTNAGEVKRQFKYMPVVAAQLPEKAVLALEKNPNIAYVEEVGVVQAIGQLTPWGISHIKATEVQQTGVTGTGIKVGVIDTGIDYTHEDLQVSGGETFVQGTTNYMDDNGHGTHVAGTIASVNNAVGVLGVAPQSLLYAIKVLDQYGGGSYSDLVAGIEWAITNQMDIVNMSLGGSNSSKTLETALNNAYNAGILLVAAAGNNGYDRMGTISYPAKYKSVIAVGALDQKNQRASFSSVGRELELMAPGVGIDSTVSGGYASYSGTSMASPHVTGAAALVLQAKPTLTNVQVRNYLNQTAVSLGDSISYGNGLVDAAAATNYSEKATTSVGGGKKDIR